MIDDKPQGLKLKTGPLDKDTRAVDIACFEYVKKQLVVETHTIEKEMQKTLAPYSSHDVKEEHTLMRKKNS